MRSKDLILGTMNASKSAHLIIRAYNLQNRQGKKILAFKPEGDSRDGAFIVSRALQEKLPATVVKKDDDGSSMELLVKIEQPDVVLVDEVQFFSEQQIESLAKISLMGVDIYAYGLLISYTSRMFDATKRAIESGFRIVTMDMQCDKDGCHNDASHHLYYIDGVLQTEGSGIAVEDEEFKKAKKEYLSVCYSCYDHAVQLQKMKEEYKNKK